MRTNLTLIPLFINKKKKSVTTGSHSGILMHERGRGKSRSERLFLFVTS